MSEQDSLFKQPGTTEQTAAASGTSPTPFSSAMSRDDLAAQLKASQRSVSNLLILLLVVSGTLSIFLLQEVRYDRADLAALKGQEEQLQQARQLIDNYNQQTVPAMQNFLKQLASYAEAHPDVMPILMKYGLARPGNPQSAAPAGQRP